MAEINLTDEQMAIVENQYYFIAAVRNEIGQIKGIKKAIEIANRQGIPRTPYSGIDNLKELSYLALSIYVLANPKLVQNKPKGFGNV